MVKFTKAQMQFIKAKFAEKEVFFDEEKFAKDAEEFVPEKKRVYKEVPSELRCTSTKKDGNPCTKKAQEGKETCGIHSKTTEERKAIRQKATRKTAGTSREGVISLEA
jgi:hypothetical protein